MRKLITILFVIFCQVSFGQVYQIMPQYGYSAPRMNFDSTLTIPTFNGVPTLKSNITRKGALAIDSTNGRFYFYNPKTLVWDTIKGGGGSTSATKLVTSVYNNTGSTIAKGSVVYISGRHSSNLPTIALAEANSEQNSYKTFALVENDIPTSNEGVVIQAGKIENLNLPTSSFTDGDIVYLSPTVPGGLTITKPLAPNHICKIGSVTRAHPTFGSIEIKIENGWQLDELSDVQIALVPVDSTILQFSRVDSLWHDVSINNAIGSKYLKPSDSTIYQTKFRLDTARTNTYSAIAAKFTLPSLTSGSVLFSNGTTIAQKNSNFFWDNTNNRLGLGTTSPANTFDVIRGTAGAMGRSTYESASFSFNGDAKLGVYTSSATSTDGASIQFGQTNLQANSRYPGLDIQYVYSSSVASNALRINYVERSSTGVVQNYAANIFQAYANGTVIINPTTSGVTATAKLLIGTGTSSSYMLDVNGTARATQFFLSALNTAPATASSTGTTGEIRIDANYIYICTATNTWKRVGIATW